MVSHLWRAFSSLLLICLISSSLAQEKEEDNTEKPPFPYIQNYTFYYTEVQLTDLELLVAAFASEYFDSTGGPRGRVDVTTLGEKRTVIYNDDQVIAIDSTGCEVSDAGFSQFNLEPIFAGWLNKDPVVIGPSASIWMADADRGNITYEGVSEIRDIDCEAWKYNYTTERNKLMITYHFASKNWTTPYEIDSELRVPVRVVVEGQSSLDSEDKDEWYPINQITDFVFFRPSVPDFRKFQPDEGIGCKTEKNNKKMPTMPDVFRYSAEVVDLIQAGKTEVTDVEYQQVWYDLGGKLARLDKYTKQRSMSELYDFGTGVTYSIVDRRTCTIGPLRNAFFEGYAGKMIGHIKEPNEVMELSGDFYFLGQKLWRGMWVDVYESVQTDEIFMKKTLSKMVVTVYYTQEFLEVAVNGETEVRIPVFYTVKGWDNQKKVVINLQYNIFGFDDVIYPDMYASFRLGRCFPSLNQKSYFILVIGVEEAVAAKMEGQDDFIMEQLRARITQSAKISNLRLPFLRADYKTTGVYVTGLMLDRPPALKQFWLESEGAYSTNDPKLRVAPAANTEEKCAFACVEEGMDCLGFYMCNEACYLKFKDILEPDKGNTTYNFQETCKEWLRAERDSKNDEPYLKDALKSLEDAVLDLQVNVSVKIDERAFTTVKVSDIVIGDGPYTGISGQDKPYSVVINFAKLDPEDETTEVLSYIDNLNDCYLACKNTEDLSCSSFSYCPNSDNKQCSISSILVVDRKHNPDDTTDDKNCYVYSMKYLDYFTAYPGRLALIPGADVFNKIKTVEECAKLCRTAQDITCRGFEYCQSTKTCVLHSKHVLDLNPGEVIINKKSTCIHFAAKYAADYQDLGLVLVDDIMDERSEISMEDCARACSEELKDKCQSFNYCPASGPYMTDSSCALSSVTLRTPRVATTKEPPCHHYEKRNQVDDWVKAGKKTVVSTSGYTSSQFTWLVIGMLILGFVLGGLGFAGYSYFRSKGSDAGMTVRFMKQGNL